MLWVIAEVFDEHLVAARLIAYFQELATPRKARDLMCDKTLVQTSQPLSDGVLSGLVDGPHIPISPGEINGYVTTDANRSGVS